MPTYVDEPRLRRFLPQQRGFTLIELMIVIAIIATIAAIAIPALIEARKGSNESAAIGALRTFSFAQELFRDGDEDREGHGRFGTAAELYAEGLIDGGLAGAAGVALGTESSSGVPVPPHSPAGKHGYFFGLTLPPTNSSPASPGGNITPGFVAVAFPTVAHGTGDRSFYIDETGVLLFRCLPPQEWNPVTEECDPESQLVDGVAVAAIAAIDALSGGQALQAVLQDPPDPVRIQQVIVLLDANGDGSLTFREVLKADILAMARSLAGTSPPAGRETGRDLLRQILRRFDGSLERELAPGIGNEEDVAVAVGDVNGSPTRLLELAARYSSRLSAPR